ncbi:hypothetical protein [Piscirickettsia litoralis]|uniref:Uncharacterized protein n=1 Tax=Piscirickettsia litoralis TaxID=1891921 RepID=A0ABX2ZWR0_9GAMM|nr:hypothetical protein [Piscirickettsia litoralis]ODN41071.1 hypothetical protein BGC07_18155 [Piscirickettsia litoralis]
MKESKYAVFCSLTPQKIQELALKYLREHPKPNMFGNHNQQTQARTLINLFGGVATPEVHFETDDDYDCELANIDKMEYIKCNAMECCIRLINFLKELEGTKGSLTEDITDLLNDTLGTNIQLHTNTTTGSISRSLGRVAEDFANTLRNYPKDFNGTQKDEQKILTREGIARNATLLMSSSAKLNNEEASFTPSLS